MSTVTVPRAAELMGIHPHSVWKLIDQGAIPAAKIGRAYIMMERDVLAYVEAQILRQTAERMGGAPVKRRRRASSP